MGNLNVTTGITWRPAYVYIQESIETKKNKKTGDEGEIHGTLMRQIAGFQPKEIAKHGGCTAGFGIRNGVFSYNSTSTNRAGEYSDASRTMSDNEMKIINAAVT